MGQQSTDPGEAINGGGANQLKTVLPDMLTAPLRTHSCVLVVHPDDADSPLPVVGDFTVEFSRQVRPGSYLLMAEQDILDGMAAVLAMA